MTILVWGLFLVLVLGMLGLDLGVFHRRAHAVGTSEALAWTAFWVAAALAFNAVVFFLYEHHWFGIGLDIGHELGGHEAALQFFTGYLIEKSLSLDNIFVIALIFAYFSVPLPYQHRTLFWGILGALMLRGFLILTGAALLRRFDWVVYVFGAFLLITAVKMLIVRHDNLEPERNPLVKLARRLFSMTSDFHAEKFFVRCGAKWAATPLFLVLLMVESADVLFAIDSIPAIFAVTRDPFLVFTSNVFALLGLRSLYFVLAGIMGRFRYLKFSLVFILAFVGMKMILSHHYPIPTPISLIVIVGMLLVGILASFWAGGRDPVPLASPMAMEIEQLAMMTWKQARRVVAIVTGTTLLAAGLALLFLPGPGILVLALALGILGTEFLWARRLLRRVRRDAESIGRRVLGGKEGD